MDGLFELGTASPLSSHDRQDMHCHTVAGGARPASFEELNVRESYRKAHLVR